MRIPKIPFLTKKRNSDNPKPAKASKKEKQRALSAYEQSQQRRREYNKRLRERY
jgi:hypothetical protein